MKERGRHGHNDERFSKTEQRQAEVWEATAAEIPWLRRGEVYPVRTRSFQDHGRPCLQAELIQSNRLFEGAYRQLQPTERERIQTAFRAEVERTLDGKPGMKAVVMSGNQKTNISVCREVIGNPANPDLVFWHGRRRAANGTNISFLIAGTKYRDANTIQRVFVDAGYPKKV